MSVIEITSKNRIENDVEVVDGVSYVILMQNGVDHAKC